MSKWRFMWIDMAGLACCVLIAAAGYVIAVMPVIRAERNVSSLRLQIGAGKTQADSLLHRTREVEQILHDVQSRLDDSSLELEPAERVNTRVDTLTRMASVCGLSLDEVLPRDPESKSLYRTVPIRMKGTGSYTDVAVFLHRLRTKLRDTAVRSLQVINDPTGESEPTFVFELVWYAAPAGRAG